jgi:malto-oligosyltrehalose trehalohydrolase
MSARFASRLPFGANLVAPDRAEFSLWAPGAGAVTLELENAAPLPMQRDAEGVFRCETACAANRRYRYRLQNGLAVPDPASRQQAESVDGYSVVVDPADYAWVHPQWPGRPWHESAIYELHPGCFGGCFGGSFTAVAERLTHLAALGVTTLELMPIADFHGRRNWGYDGVLPYAPARAYGTPQQLKALVDAAHGLGLCIILDVVYNHFGPAGNYLHAYAPQFFDAGRQSPWGDAIDFSRPQVREFFIANAIYWLTEYRFDGLRLDAVHAIGDSSFLEELAGRAHQAVEPGRQIHLILENEANQAELLEPRLNGGFDAQWNDDGHNVLHHLLTGERDSYYANYVAAPAAKLARCLAEGFAYQGEPCPSHNGRPRGNRSAHLPPHAFVLFLQNHDQVGNRAFGERLGALADPQALEAAITLQLLSPQIPLIFMGEEWAAEQPFLYFTDFHGELAEAVREGRRREFAAFAAFRDPRQRARIPDPNAPETFERSQLVLGEWNERQLARLQLYRRLLQLRRECIAPHLAAACSLGAQGLGEAAAVAQWRLGDGSRLWIGINLGRETVLTAPPPGNLLFESLAGCAGYAAAGQLLPNSCGVFLEPWQ